jgi:hypothetical protein
MVSFKMTMQTNLCLREVLSQGLLRVYCHVEVNQSALLELPTFLNTLFSFLDAQFKLAGGVRLAAACLLHQMTTNETGRVDLLKLIDHHRYPVLS